MLRIIQNIWCSLPLRYQTVYLDRHMYRIRFKTQCIYTYYYFPLSDQSIYYAYADRFEFLKFADYALHMKFDITALDNQ